MLGNSIIGSKKILIILIRLIEESIKMKKKHYHVDWNSFGMEKMRMSELRL